MWHAWERGENRTVFWWESPKERENLTDRGVDWGNGIRMDFKEIGWGQCGVDSPGSG
jgi:hypothetical protein